MAVKPKEDANKESKKEVKVEKVESKTSSKSASKPTKDNSKFAIIGFKGKQHLVSEGEELSIIRIDAKPGDKVEPDVLLYSDDKDTKVGKPFLTDNKVVLEVVKHDMGEKIKAVRFRAKSRSRRKYGYRQPLSILKVVKIS